MSVFLCDRAATSDGSREIRELQGRETMRGIRACLCACSTLSLLVGTASPAFAQDASVGTVQHRAATSGARSPTEIVASAHKLVARPQGVPIAISAYRGEPLAAHQAEGGLDRMTPG